MATTSDYLQQLQTDKTNLVANLVEKGVEATNEETFTELVPKVLDIPSDASFEINDASYLFYYSARLDIMNELISKFKNVKDCNHMYHNAAATFFTDAIIFDTSNSKDMSYMHYGCVNLETIPSYDMTNATTAERAFYNNQKLIKYSIGNFSPSILTVTAYMFDRCQKLSTLIIDNPNVFPMTATNMLQNTPIASGTGYVYVPDDMIDTYKSATNWSTYADQIKGMSELPVEGE